MSIKTIGMLAQARPDVKKILVLMKNRRVIELPKCFHKLICKVTMAQKKEIFEGRQVIEELELIDEDLKQPLACNLIRRVN